MRIILIITCSIYLTSCAALSSLSSLMGGSSTSSKGHGNDNELVIGSDVTKGVNTGHKNTLNTKRVGGDVTGGDSQEYNAEVMSHGISWWQMLIISMVLGLLIPSPLSLLWRNKK